MNIVPVFKEKSTMNYCVDETLCVTAEFCLSRMVKLTEESLRKRGTFTDFPGRPRKTTRCLVCNIKMRSRDVMRYLRKYSWGRF